MDEITKEIEKTVYVKTKMKMVDKFAIKFAMKKAVKKVFDDIDSMGHQKAKDKWLKLIDVLKLRMTTEEKKKAKDDYDYNLVNKSVKNKSGQS